MKRFTLIFILISIFFSQGIAFALIGADDLVPAQRILVPFFRYSFGDSTEPIDTLITIRNVSIHGGGSPLAGALLVHISFFDVRSNHINNNTINLSRKDCVGLNIREYNEGVDSFFDSDGDGLAEGYIVFDIVSEDTGASPSRIVGVRGQNNPDRFSYPFPTQPENWLIGEALMVNVEAGYAVSLAAPSIEATAVSGVDRTPAGFESPIAGPHPNPNPNPAVDYPSTPANPDTAMAPFNYWGAPETIWIPYRVDPDLGIETTAIIWLESNAPPAGRTVTLAIFDTEENGFSFSINLPDQLNIIPLGPPLFPMLGSGSYKEGFIEMVAPDDAVVFVIESANQWSYALSFLAFHSGQIYTSLGDQF